MAVYLSILYWCVFSALCGVTLFHNVFRDLPVDLKTETMQMKLRRVMCGDESFALVGRCCHVTCPLLIY